MRKAVTTAIAALLVVVPASAAHAVDYGVHIYMSAPHVQGSSVTSNATTETFDGYSTGTCPANLLIGTWTGDCAIVNADDYGGASSSSASPVINGVGTNYATMSSGSPTMTVTLSSPAKYLGLWWSAGSPTNTITFYSNGQEVAQMTTAGLITQLSSPSQTAVDGSTTYTSADYEYNPVNNLDAGEPFLYLNVYAVGGTSFDSFTLEGAGFEYDNITVSDLEQTVADELVDVQFIPGLIPPSDTSGSGSGSGSGSHSTSKLAATGFDVTAPAIIAVALGAAGVALRRRRSLR